MLVLRLDASRLAGLFAILVTVALIGTGCDSVTSSESSPSALSSATAQTPPPSSEDPPGSEDPPSGEEDPETPPSSPYRPDRGQGSGPIADVRVGHLSPDAPAVDVFVSTEPGEGAPAVAGLSYGTFAPNADGDYVGFRFGTVDIAVTPAGEIDPQVIDVDGLELGANKDYTILAIGELFPENGEPGIQALPLVDNADGQPALPPRSKTLVRFVHASPDAGLVDIAVDGTIVLEKVAFATASPYLKARPGARTIEILKDGTPVLTVPADLVAGTKITAYVIGNATPEEGDAPLSAVTTLDAVSPAGTGPLGR